MRYFEGLTLIAGGHVTRCSVWMVRSFNYYALNFARSGTVRWQTAAGRMQELRAPVAFWTWPGPNFAYGCDRNEHWDQHWVSFRGPRAERMRRRGLMPDTANPWRPVHDPGRFAEDFLRVIDYTQQPSPPPRATALLEDLFLRLHETPDLPVKQDPIAEVQSRIEADPEHPWDPDTLAEEVALSTVQFRRRFKSTAGLPPTAFVIHCRMRRAADLLRTTPDPAKTIGQRVGYDDPYHFTKLFKQHFGLPPVAYREEMRGLVSSERD